MKTQRTHRLGGALLALATMAAPAAAAPFVGGSTETSRYPVTAQAPVYGGQPYAQKPYPQQAYAPPQGVARQPAPAYTQQPAQAYAQQQPAAAYGAATRQAYPSTQQAYSSTPGYGAPRVAYQQPTAAENLPETAESVAPGPSYESTPQHYGTAPTTDYSAPAYTAPAAPAASAATSYAPATAGGDCGCNQSTPSYQGYAAPSSCDTGCYGGCESTACASYDCGPKRQWFGGIYGLYMQRDRPGNAYSAVLVDGVTTPYYPMPSDTYLTSNQADTGYAAGAEVRFGSTFGYACNPCGCGGYQPFAWEVGYWAIDDDSSQSIVSDMFGGTTRMYGMINYAGIEYDRDGAGTTYGYRPVNDYYDYQMPIGNNPTNNVRVLANRVRQNFSAQNIELNFWRFGAPAPTGGCGYAAAACGSDACGSGSCGGDSCGYSSCGSGACGSLPCVAPKQRFFISGLMGVRFVEFDEFFQNAVFFTIDDGAGSVVAGEPGSYPNGMPINEDNVIFHDIDVDNDLVGFQLGCSMNCLVGCRWTLFADTNFGIYGNDADVYQRVYSGGGGNVRFVGDTSNAAVSSSKQDVAFLGEWRMGMGYQMTCHCRATLAWRVMAASGVALASEQIPDAGFTNSGYVGQIDSNDSLILHGLQAGVECKY